LTILKGIASLLEKKKEKEKHRTTKPTRSTKISTLIIFLMYQTRRVEDLAGPSRIHLQLPSVDPSTGRRPSLIHGRSRLILLLPLLDEGQRGIKEGERERERERETILIKKV
jgi:hypothetical protein